MLVRNVRIVGDRDDRGAVVLIEIAQEHEHALLVLVIQRGAWLSESLKMRKKSCEKEAGEIEIQASQLERACPPHRQSTDEVFHGPHGRSGVGRCTGDVPNMGMAVGMSIFMSVSWHGDPLFHHTVRIACLQFEQRLETLGRVEFEYLHQVPVFVRHLLLWGR